MAAWPLVLMEEPKAKKTQQPKSAKNSINAEYRVAKNKCSLLSGGAEDACLAEAKATKTKAMTNAGVKNFKGWWGYQ